MVLGNLSWDSAKLGIFSHSNSVSGVNLSQQQVFHTEEGKNRGLFLSLPSTHRITPDGYLTNAPSELGEKDFTHAVAYTNANKIDEDWDGVEPKLVEFDQRWKALCSSNDTPQNSVSFAGYTSTRIRDEKITNMGSIDSECMDWWKDSKHYWVDKTQGPFTVGCSDEDADNYTTDADYKDDDVCTYSCSDPNRNTTAEGKCDDSCVDGYGLNDEGVCQEGISARFIGGIESLPWGWIGAGFALIIGGKIWMGRKR